jgi:serine protease Do
MTIMNPRKRARAAILASSALILLTSVAVPVVSTARAEITAPAAGVTQLSSIAEIVARAKPAVVTVEVTAEASPAQVGMPGGPGPTPYDEFFKRFFGEQGPGPFKMMPAPGMPEAPKQVMHGLGSGFIISEDGLIVTNNHVVDGAQSIRVTLDDGTEHDATLVGRDPKTDIAVLRISADGKLPTLDWGPSAGLQVGDPIIAIGNPFGVGTTVTSGIVSARGRDLHNGPYDDFIQVDAAINHGNSGGPLLDATGEVVGVNAAIYSPNDGNVGVGFAIPSDQARTIVARLVENGTIERGYLGVQIQPVTQDLAAALGLDQAKGALVARVEPDTPAAKAGLQTGDVIVGLDGQEVADARALSRQVADLAPDSAQSLKVIRDGKEMNVSVTIGQLPGEDEMAALPASADGSRSLPELGLSVLPLTPERRDQLGLDPGARGLIVTDVAANGAAAEVGVAPGDVIVSVNMQPVESVSDASQAVSAAEESGRDAILLQIARNGTESFVGVPVKASTG